MGKTKAQTSTGNTYMMNQKFGLDDLTFICGQTVKKKSGSEWQGVIVGFYSTELTPEGYAVESSSHKGSVQIYPVAALELVQ